MAYQFLSTILGINANFTGNVGVGTTTPNAKLDVSTNAGRLRITQNTAGNTLNGLEFAGYNNVVLAGLLFNQSTGEVRLNTISSYFPTIYSNGAEVVRIPTSGNVLINTTTDGGYKLDVNGTARINSTLSLTNSTYAGTFSFYLSAANIMQASSSNIGPWLQVGGGNRVYIVGQEFYSTARGNQFGNTVGGEAISAVNIIAQSSGTTATTGLSLRYTINNTGTYVGITRGIYYNPTVTSLTGTTHRAIETVVGDVIFGSTSGNVGIGTTTLGTSTELTLGGSQTASSAIARGGLVNTTLVAAANSDVLVGLDITPTFTNGAFTGVSNLALRANGIAAINSGLGAVGTYALSVSGSSSTLFSIRGFGDANLAATLYLGGYGGSNYISNGTLNILSSQATGNQFVRFTHNNGTNALRVLSNSVIELNPSAGNVLVGTTTDAGYKLDVLGTIRAYNTSNGQSTIRIDTNGTSDMAAQLVFMQNSPNWSSQIGTHTSGGGLNYGLQFRSQASVVNMVMNRDGSNYFGGTFALASARVHIKGSGSTSSTSSLLVQNSSSTELFRVRDDGNVGIGTSSPAAKLHLSQSSGNTESIIEAIGGTPIFTMLGTSSSVPLFGFNGTGLRIGSVTGANAAGFSEFMRITSAGNVGIGTSSPGSKLEISGPTGSYSSGIGFTPTGTGARVYRTYIGTNGFFYFDDASAGATRITLSASGNLGIGTNNPDYFATSGRTILSLNGASSSLLEFKVGDVFQSYIYNSGSTFEFYSSNRFDFYTAGVARLVIAPSGNVLIGTLTDNGSKLQVAGNATLGQGQNRPVTYDSNGGNFRITANPSGWATGYFFNGSSGTFRGGFGAYGDFDNIIYHWIGDDYNIPTMTLYPNQGNVGISTTSPAQKLDVNGLIRTNRTSNTDGGVVFGTAGTYLYGADSGGYLATYTTNLERMRVTSDGNVGIGTTSGFNSISGTETTLSIASTNVASIYLNSTSAGNKYALYSSAGGTFQIYNITQGTYPFAVANSSNVLIGITTDNGNKLQVVGNVDSIGGGIKIGFNVNDAFTYYGTSTAHYGMSYGGSTNPVVLSGYFGLAFTTVGSQQLFISTGGSITAASLAGSGTRMVVADSSGTLSTQAIPGGGSSYGSWQDNNTQTAATNNTGYGIQFNTTNFNSGVTVIPDSLSALTLIKFANAGKYDIQFSFQFQNTSADDETVYIWIRKNGENTPDDVPDSNTIISIPKKHGSGTPGNTVAAWNLFVDAATNDFYQLVWATSNATDVTMQYYGATGFCPATPSAILTVNQVD